MSNKFFNAEEMIEAGVSTVKKQVTQQITNTQKSVSNQITGDTSGVPEIPNAQSNSTQNQANQDQATKDFVKDLYGSNDQSLPQNQANSNSSNNNPQNTPLTFQGKSIDAPSTPEDAERLAKARKSLMEQHMTTYYNPTFESSPKQEEDTADKLEREKQEEEAKKMEELQIEQKKNEVPMAVRMGAQKAEKFRGAAG